MLHRLDQKGTGSGPEAPNSSGAADAPPAERRDLERFAVRSGTLTRSVSEGPRSRFGLVYAMSS